MAPNRSEQLSMFASASRNAQVRERLKRVRVARGWDQSRLAGESGIPQPKISQIELGRLAPTDEQVDALANALGYSSDFLRAELRMIPTTRPWLRAYADASKREADARTEATTLAAEYVRRLDLKPLPDLIPRFEGSLEDDEAIEEFAAEVRALAGLDADAVVANAMRATERLGCVVLPLESELGRHLGMSVRADQIPFMCVAKAHVPGDRQRWTVAHELGHLALHADIPPPPNAREAKRMEEQAHRFASGFLCPAEAFQDTLNQAGGVVTLRSLAEVKAVWGVAIKALVHRCQSLGIVDADHARSLYKQISARKWSKDEPVHVPIETAQWFERTLTRKAKTDDLETACKYLAPVVGGNASDLLALADWSEGPDATVLSFSAHQRQH